MKVFRFKRFEVRNELAAQKVGTDAVLLGAALTLPDELQQHLLDIGTGTGVIALMVAQRLADRITSPFKILAIDIDPAAASEATANFAASPWAPSLHAEALSLNDLERQLNSLDMAATMCERRECRLADAPGGQRPFPACPDETHLFAAIFSNPPYFEASLKAPNARRSTARHTDTLSYREICAFAASHLTPDGILSLILPASEEQPLLRYAASFGLRPFRILRIRTTARKPASRIIAEFRRTKTSSTPGDTSHASSSTPINKGRPQNLNTIPAEELILMSGTDRSPAYAALTKDFYL